MTTEVERGRDPEHRDVVVCYECSSSRERAVGFCDQLTSRFWHKCTLNINWWSFPQLIRPDSAVHAADHAKDADVVIIAARPEGNFPPPIIAWLGSWAGTRQDREGYLVGLVGGPGQGWTDVSEKDLYLRQLAHRAGLDYLTGLPPALIRPIPDSLDSYHERADCMTTVLDEILRLPSGPPRQPVSR